MKQYSFFFVVALLIHGLLLLPFWLQPAWLPPLTGGASGATISISITPAPPDQEGRRRTRPQPAAVNSRGFDKGHSPQAGSGQGPSAGPGRGPGSSTQGWDKVLAQIRARIERSKHYPLMARRRGFEGTANVAFRIAEDGSVRDVKLVTSSGISPLDEAALTTIRRAAPFPYYPEPIQIGIRFTLASKSGE